MSRIKSFARGLAGVLAAGLLALAGPLQAAEVVEHLAASIHQPVYGARGMVVSQNQIASAVGARILAAGGNAVDAGVATAFALAVVLPRAGNIGGDGFMLLWLAQPQRALVIDYRSIAPRAARTAMYVGKDGKELELASHGYLAPSVPGTVAGLYKAQTTYGRLKWSQVVAPALALARDGFPLSYEHVTVFGLAAPRLAASTAAQAAFRKPGGGAYAPGEILRQPDLAWTLQQISDRGADGFYKGEVAARIAADMKKHGGLITARDLAAYQPIERTALVGSYRGLTVYTAPPASSGGTALLEMLNILESYDLAAMKSGSAQSLHVMAEAMKLAYADRVEFLGDPAFVKSPVQALISKPYARTRAALISLEKATDPKVLGTGDPWKFESPSTTHFSVADAEGNALSNTFTLGSDFGSGVMVEGAGFLLNNQMNNFAHEADVKAAKAKKAAPLNGLQPGKRMLSSMTPTIVMKSGKPWLVTGTPGGSTIIDTVLQIVVDVVDFGVNIADATHQPRIYQGWTNELQVEPGLSPDTAALLQSMGHRVTVAKTVIGSTQTIMIEPGRFSGAADSRRPDAGAVAP
jgi:gamma-glutamyltranspeptidase / glutathione hydrolase